ncbi:MAG: hypothetical protein A3B41_00405 [Candidatus Levybacteria bacterium RIFCSPLOWO2_01_FULL_37_26]|nr:MAG: hypothetical protein A3E40_05050 [Candidatus Levybacteria bacterium RIFCSPHIGHO2_12_FULL_37_9]OGH39573.1 MAG: hypothetical protein A3B41_00405 [Candidatus Levybacteria bacterium RIFCSPLOWO2_01_FULL_37_26]
MNKGIIIAGVGIVLVGGVIFAANQQSQKTEEAKMAQRNYPIVTLTQEQIATEREKKAMMEKTNDGKAMTKNSSSRYVEYSKAALDQAIGNRRVLFFYANWCSTCRPTDANFKENISKIPEDVTVIRVNFNDSETTQEEKDLAKKYGITYQHTFVQIDSDGKEVTKWNGGQTNELLNKIK